MRRFTIWILLVASLFVHNAHGAAKGRAGAKGKGGDPTGPVCNYDVNRSEPKNKKLFDARCVFSVSARLSFCVSARHSVYLWKQVRRA